MQAFECHDDSQVFAHPIPAVFAEGIHDTFLRLTPALQTSLQSRLTLRPEPDLLAIRRHLADLDESAPREWLEIASESGAVEAQVIRNRRDRSWPEPVNTRQDAEKRPANRRIGHLFGINSTDN